MTTANSTQSQESSAPTGVLSSSSVVEALWEKSKNNLSRAELEWFSYATVHASDVSRNLQNVVEGVGCLVDGDTDNGNFQSKGDVASLLFFVAESLGSIRGMMEVGHEAEYKLRMMHEAKLKQLSASITAEELAS